MARKTRRRGRRVRITRRFRKVIGGSRKYHNGGHIIDDIRYRVNTGFNNGIEKIKEMGYRAKNATKNALRIK
jgi:hypothetical protein